MIIAEYYGGPLDGARSVLRPTTWNRDRPPRRLLVARGTDLGDAMYEWSGRVTPDGLAVYRYKGVA